MAFCSCCPGGFCDIDDLIERCPDVILPHQTPVLRSWPQTAALVSHYWHNLLMSFLEYSQQYRRLISSVLLTPRCLPKGLPRKPASISSILFWRRISAVLVLPNGDFQWRFGTLFFVRYFHWNQQLSHMGLWPMMSFQSGLFQSPLPVGSAHVVVL